MMATVHDLANPHFLQLPSAERFALIRGLRTARRQAKPKPVVAELGPRKAKAKTKKIQFTGDLAGLSQEQLSQLMEMMQNDCTD